MCLRLCVCVGARVQQLLQHSGMPALCSDDHWHMLAGRAIRR